MRKLGLLLLVLAPAFPLFAQENWLENGDFADGTSHWRGDGRTPADMTADADPFAKPDPLLSKGLIIPLKDREWTKIIQDFRTKAADLVMSVTFVLSPGLAFSDRDEDYVNIPKQIDNLLYRSFNFDKSRWLILFTDFGNDAKGEYYDMDCKLGTTDPQTVRVHVTNVSPLEHEVVTIAFPSGKGNVILQSVALTGN